MNYLKLQAEAEAEQHQSIFDQSQMECAKPTDFISIQGILFLYNNKYI